MTRIKYQIYLMWEWAKKKPWSAGVIVAVHLVIFTEDGWIVLTGIWILRFLIFLFVKIMDEVLEL